MFFLKVREALKSAKYAPPCVVVLCVYIMLTRATRSPKFSRGACFLQGSIQQAETVIVSFQEAMQTIRKVMRFLLLHLHNNYKKIK